ncbi:MAG: glycine cleavage system protein H [Alphaproteobacteria bacterium CG11_big_fil_rev_8_21_14_0_20_44_7]|nr:MAG: glycine cleavage system protein H [Alphaproteobacteria bacterium CG11_big_fil_rev_8_21_14_0_20_44_7]
MTNIAENLKYTKDHEWVKKDGDVATIGITDFAQNSLGDLVYVELPQIGRKVEKGEEFVVVESCKAASDVYAPLSGEVVEVNTALADSPESVNSEPYDSGWLVKLRPANSDDAEALMSAEEYKNHISE